MDTLATLFSSLDAPDAARRLLGCELLRTFDEGIARVKIVETEAYHQSDAASHSFNGRTNRTEVMFGPAAHMYVYFTYGMHYCCNVVCGPEGTGAAVLIRAVEPIGDDSHLMSLRNATGVKLTNGPAKLCQALAIDTTINGHDLEMPPVRLIMNPQLHSTDIVQTTRIGISKAVDMPWRFYIRGNPYVSKP